MELKQELREANANPDSVESWRDLAERAGAEIDRLEQKTEALKKLATDAIRLIGT